MEGFSGRNLKRLAKKYCVKDSTEESVSEIRFLNHSEVESVVSDNVKEYSMVESVCEKDCEGASSERNPLSSLLTITDNQNIASMLQKISETQAIILQKMTNIERQLQLLKADQNNTQATLKQLLKRNVHVGNDADFPITTFEQMQNINSIICSDPDAYIAKLRTIMRPGGLANNFKRILHEDLILCLNYDGVNGKKGFKEFKALHDALFEAMKEEGHTLEKYKKDLQHCFKMYKNRFFAQKCRNKKEQC